MRPLPGEGGMLRRRMLAHYIEQSAAWSRRLRETNTDLRLAAYREAGSCLGYLMLGFRSGMAPGFTMDHLDVRWLDLTDDDHRNEIPLQLSVRHQAEVQWPPLPLDKAAEVLDVWLKQQLAWDGLVSTLDS